MIKQSLSTIDAACYSISATIDNAETKKVSMQFDFAMQFHNQHLILLKVVLIPIVL
jgi:hypothetical protein